MPPRDAAAYLHDILRVGTEIQQFTQGKTWENYERTPILQAAVERHFVTIGEALSQLYRIQPDMVAEFPEHPQIIAFRNVLVHGYTAVDDAVVWSVVEEKLPALLERAQEPDWLDLLS